MREAFASDFYKNVKLQERNSQNVRNILAFVYSAFFERVLTAAGCRADTAHAMIDVKEGAVGFREVLLMRRQSDVVQIVTGGREGEFSLDRKGGITALQGELLGVRVAAAFLWELVGVARIVLDVVVITEQGV